MYTQIKLSRLITLHPDSSPCCAAEWSPWQLKRLKLARQLNVFYTKLLVLSCHSVKMADIISLKESVLVYLDRSGGLQKLAEDCKPFNGRPAVWKMKKLSSCQCHYC